MVSGAVTKLVVGAALIALLAIAYLFGPPLARSPAPERTQQQQSAASSADARVEVTEAALDDRLNQRLKGQSIGSTPLGTATVQRLATRLRSGEVHVDGDMDVGGKTIPLAVSSTVSMENGRPLVDVKDARAAGVPLPEPARQSLQQALQQQVDQEVQRLNVRVTGIRVEEGKIVILGTPAGRS